MADESTREFLRNTRKRRDEKAKEEAARGDKTNIPRPAEDKAWGKRPMKEKASLKRPAAEAPEVLAPKRSGNLLIREPSELGSQNKDAKKTPAKETSKEALKETKKSPQAHGPSFSFYIPRINDKFADRSALEDPDLARAFARDAITPRDFMEMKKSTVEQNIKTAVCLAYQVMARSTCTLREYESPVNQFGVAEALINKVRAIGHKEIEAREAAEVKLKLAEQQATQTATDLQKRTSEVEEL